MSYARWYKAQSLYTKQRFAKGVQRNITDFLKASITTDSIKIFSITFCTLVTVYCTCKIAKDAFRIVLYVTTFYMQLCAVACFVLKQWFVYSWDVQCCMLLKDSVFVLWINNFKCAQFKDECEPGFSYWTFIKLQYKWSHKSDVIVVTHLLYGHLSQGQI